MNRTYLVGTALGWALSLGCAKDHPRPSGGGSIHPAGSISGLYVAGGEDSLARIDLESGLVRHIQVGNEPTRIAHVGSRVYATLRNQRQVAVLEESGAELVLAGRIETGAEPFGVAATETRVYVAASVGGVVTEYDASTFEPLRSWEISGEPRWITLHPNHRALYVGSTYGATLTHIDLLSGEKRDAPLPQIQGFSSQDGTPFTLTPRITGDLAVAPDGEDLYVPMLYVDNRTPIRDVDPSSPETDACGSGDAGARRAPPPPDGEFAAPPPPPGGGCGSGYDNQKFNPAIDKVPLDPETGVPDVARPTEAINIVGFVSIEDASGFQIGGEPVNGYPAALAVSGDSKDVFAAIEGGEAVLVMRAEIEGDTGGGVLPLPEKEPAGAPAPRAEGDAFFGGGGGQGFSFRPIVSIRTGAGPRGIVIMGDRAYVHAFFDRKVQEIDVGSVREMFDVQVGGGLTKDLLDVAVGGSGSEIPKQLSASGGYIVSLQSLDPETDQGRRLFYASNNPLMATMGAGVSCATCHFDLRTDGVTWTFERGPRQTPNLSVNLRDAVPVGWAGNVATVADEGFSTSQKLMGGQGLTPTHSRAIEKFLFSARAIDTPFKNVQDPRVVRGQATFANVGCLSCHNGPSQTDNQVYSMLGLDRVKTRPLAGISASAPYFHDGSAATLRDVIERASRGEMGLPFTLTDEQKEDLVVYLKSL